MKDNIKVQAILNTDLEKLLAQTNQLNDFIEGKMKCPVCGTTLTEDNIGIMYPFERDGETMFEIHCNSINCNSW